MRAALAGGAARLAAAGVPDAGPRRAPADGRGAGRRARPADARRGRAAAAGGGGGLRAHARRAGAVRGRWRRSSGGGRSGAATSRSRGAVLDPRPETETLVALALAGPAPARILDLGTGSGAILVTLLAEWPEARGLGTDIDAGGAGGGGGERGAARGRGAGRVPAGRLDRRASTGASTSWSRTRPTSPTAEVAALAPDVRDWEPRHALTPGPTGLEAYARIAAGLAAVLAPGGRALFEIGAGQGAAVAALLARGRVRRVARAPRPRRARPGGRAAAAEPAADAGFSACHFRAGCLYGRRRSRHERPNSCRCDAARIRYVH